MQPIIEQTNLEPEDSLHIKLHLQPSSAYYKAVGPPNGNPEKAAVSKAFRCPINGPKELWASVATEEHIPNKPRELIRADLMEAWYFHRVNDFHANIRLD